MKDETEEKIEGYPLEYIYSLEAESLYIMREVAACFHRPVLLFSGGKDSISLVHLARKAFYPAKVPFSLLHIDTGHNFLETINFRDRLVKEMNLNLIIRYVEDTISEGKAKEEQGKFKSRNHLQTITLLDAISELEVDACIGGARRDEEKARAKERIFSFRDFFGQWDPRLQRPELWNIYNTHISKGENMRAFPLSNWTELDVWNYIKMENIELPSLYYAHRRRVIEYKNQLFPLSDFVDIEKNDIIEEKLVRFRTIGDMTCTSAIEATAKNPEEVIQEISKAKLTERGSRLDDKRSETSMEDRKRIGYF